MYKCTVPEIFLNCFLNLFFRIEMKKKIHGWTFRVANRVEKSKLKLNFFKILFQTNESVFRVSYL